MKNRYKELKKSKTNKGSVYSISLLESFDMNQKFYTTYTPSNLERLDNIAYKFYGNSKYWYIIAKANNIVNGSFYAPEGKTLKIPELK